MRRLVLFSGLLRLCLMFTQALQMWQRMWSHTWSPTSCRNGTYSPQCWHTCGEKGGGGRREGWRVGVVGAVRGVYVVCGGERWRDGERERQTWDSRSTTAHWPFWKLTRTHRLQIECRTPSSVRWRGLSANYTTHTHTYISVI